jgi:hypothetical protein
MVGYKQLQTFYDNLQKLLYVQNNYNANCVWNSNETYIQTSKQLGTWILAKRS